MTKHFLTAVLMGLAVASHGVLAQDVTGGEKTQSQQEHDYWNGLTPNYHDDDSPNYPFTA
jgi:hypothetical protein